MHIFSFIWTTHATHAYATHAYATHARMLAKTTQWTFFRDGWAGYWTRSVKEANCEWQLLSCALALIAEPYDPYDVKTFVFHLSYPANGKRHVFLFIPFTTQNTTIHGFIRSGSSLCDWKSIGAKQLVFNLLTEINCHFNPLVTDSNAASPSLT